MLPVQPDRVQHGAGPGAQADHLGEPAAQQGPGQGRGEVRDGEAVQLHHGEQDGDEGGAAAGLREQHHGQGGLQQRTCHRIQGNIQFSSKTKC